jgi:hypothetical protein
MIQWFRRFRPHIASAILAAYSLYHGLTMVASSIRGLKNPAAIDTVAAFDKRFAPLRAQLSQYGCKEVGYVTDEPENAEWFTGYFRTQYALAPTIVDDTTVPVLVVANLRDPSSSTQIMRNKHLALVKDYGSGVLLLSKETR